MSLRFRTQVALTRLGTRLMRLAGIRDHVLAWRLQRRRARRQRLESVGDQSLSRPALHELDRKLDAIVDRDGGFFIEAGANDGYTQSNTYWLERFRGWTGLLVEPMPELAQEARRSRPAATVVECALVGSEDAGPTVRMKFGDLMSMVEGARDADWPGLGTVLGWRDPYEADVPARTLSSLLDELGAPEVDLLSLDVEGYELSALQGLDLDRHAPRYVLVEIHEPERNAAPIDERLSERYVQREWLSPLDVLYVRRDVAGTGEPVSE